MSKKKKTIEELLEEALVQEEKQPYKVPKNWKWVKMGSVITLISGRDLSTKLCNSEEKGIPYIMGASNIVDNQLDVERWIETPTVIGVRGDILVSVKGTVGKVIIQELDEVHLSRQIMALRSKDTVLNKFLYLYIQTYVEKLKEVAKGIIPGISRDDILNAPFPLLPLNEQKRIADKVERLLSKIDEAKQLIEEAKKTFELRRAAILDKAFRGELTKKWREQNPNVESGFLLQKKIISELKDKSIEVINEKEIPATWKVVKMGEVVQINPKKKKLEDVPGEQICTFIPMPAVSDKTGEIEQPEEREYSKVKKGYTFFEEKDVLFAKITPCMENGKAAIAKNLKNGFGFGSTEFHVLRTSECINETYIHYFVRSKKFRLEAKREMTGAVGQQRVPKEFLINYPLPLPPKEEQDVIVRTLSEIFSKDHFVEQSLHIESKLELIKQSILSKAFRGELGTNNPSEENSIELLKAILQEQVK
ncbi:restriction endonuclease subunit S [Bacillus altitudinis]|uniref:restriction endonuclease subunit S n=1 Tax=Bacillus altitudinis TaxID=293387 RepID=UPI00248121EE|nr:restriction endonuclease subunit S [Bacillus altitudinis]